MIGIWMFLFSDVFLFLFFSLFYIVMSLYVKMPQTFSFMFSLDDFVSS